MNTQTNGKTKTTHDAVDPHAALQTLAGEKRQVPVNILPMNITHAVVVVRGLSSLILNRWSEKAKQEIRDKQMQKAKAKKEAKDPDACFRNAMYLDADGNHCIPALAFKNAIVSGARFGDDLKMTVLRGAIFVEGTNYTSLPNGDPGSRDLLPIIGPPPTMREDMVRISMGGTDLRYRPEYHVWSVHLPIHFNNRVVSLEQVYQLVNVAGFGVGVCEWRPEKNGQHGRFEADTSAPANRFEVKA